MRRLAPLVLFACVSCGGSPPPAPPVDETLSREVHAGQLALELERAAEAAARYRVALKRAQARDDLDAIGNLGYNLAVAELQANEPQKALLAAQAARTELERRGAEPFSALLLVEATALYRTGAQGKADEIAARVEGGSNTEAAARATFLRGLIADELGNEAGLAAAAGRLQYAANTPPLQADAAELAARSALRSGAPAQARQESERAVGLRRDTLDYRGLARALAVAGESAKIAGDATVAAGFFFRAGRSAAAQGDKANARTWLQQAAALAPDRTIGDTARALLGDLDEPLDRSTGEPAVLPR